MTQKQHKMFHSSVVGEWEKTFEKREIKDKGQSSSTGASKLEPIIHLISLEYLDNYEHWKKIVWGAKNSGVCEEFMRTISKKSTKYSDDGFDNVWEANCTDVKEGTIRYYAKLSNEDDYNILN